VKPTQDPRQQPLQDDEVELARVVRALPGGQPSARVDAAILAAATDALSPAPRKLRRALPWLPTWAIGTAAAAVLAVGVGLQLRPALAPAPAAAPSPAPAAPRPASRERLSVDLVAPEQAPSSAAPPPAAPSAAKARPGPPPAPPAPMPQALEMPAASAPALADEAVPFAAEAAPVPLESVPAPPAAQEDASEQQLDSITVTGSRLPREDPQARAERRMRDKSEQAAAERSQNAAQAAGLVAPLPPVSEDALLEPAPWLERIRERRRQGDLEGAKASLRLFLRTYPTAPVPTDLSSLR
jgi:hypothetical protein